MLAAMLAAQAGAKAVVSFLLTSEGFGHMWGRPGRSISLNIRRPKVIVCMFLRMGSLPRGLLNKIQSSRDDTRACPLNRPGKSPKGCFKSPVSTTWSWDFS